jgi:hypothetical protein
MAPINLHDPSNKTNALEECRFLSSIFMEPVHFSLSTIKPINSTGYLMESQILMRRLFSICSHFFGANSLAKNVSEKQHTCRHRIQSEHPHEHAACGRLILTGFNLADAPLPVSQTKMTTGGVEAGGNRVWWAASRIGGRR